MFAEQASDYTVNQIPYRARYKVAFDGSQSDLEATLLEFLEDLEAVLLDQDELNQDEPIIRENPIENRYELAAILNEDLEFSLLIYWPDNGQSPIEVTFDLDSPDSVELPIDDVFLNPAKVYFPDIKMVYNFLTRPKVTTKKSEHRSDIHKNQEWIKEHRQDYRGRWVALQDGELLADAGSAEELLQQVTPTENTLLTAVY